MRRSAKRRSWLGRFIFWSVLIVVVALLATGLYGYRWIQGYLKSDAFRAQLASQLGSAARADATLEPLTWTGPDVHMSQAALNAKREQAWKSIVAGGVQATLDFGAARDGVWRVTRINADSLRVDMRSAAEIPQNLPEEKEVPLASTIPNWLRRWIPTRTQIDEVRVQTFDFAPAAGSAGVSASGLSVVAKPANDQWAWQLRGQGGKLWIPKFPEPFRITSVSSRLDAKSLVFHDVSARWLGDSEVTARGDVPFDKVKPWSFNGSVANLDLRHLLNADWNSRLTGALEGDFEVDPAVARTKVRVKNAIVQNLPALHQVAAFTRVDRFRRIVFDVATADVERSEAAIKVTNLNLQSAGLIRVEGGFTIQNQDQAIDGELLIGVAPDTLNWVLGSRDRVFTRTRPEAPGFVWTTVRISGHVGDVREDLTNRVVIAMGLAPIDLVGQGVGVLTGTASGVGSSAVDLSKGVIKGAGEAAGKAVETGVDILKGVLPILR
jgi:hypothetical protein